MLYKMDGGLAVTFYAALNGWRLRNILLLQEKSKTAREGRQRIEVLRHSISAVLYHSCLEKASRLQVYFLTCCFWGI